MNEDAQARLREIFRDEAIELFQELASLIERIGSAGDAEVRPAIASAMRVAHNIKGAAASVGLERTAAIAHALEDVFLALGDQNDPFFREGLSLLQEAILSLERAVVHEDGELDSAIEPRLTAFAASAGRRTAPAEQIALTEVPSPKDQVGPEARSPAFEPREGNGDSGKAPAGGLSTVRIEMARLDRLFGLVSPFLAVEGDVRLRQESLERFRETFESTLRAMHADVRRQLTPVLNGLDALVTEHRKAFGSFARLSSEFRESVKQARMVPLEGLGPLLRRAADDAARSANRTVSLELAFGGLEIDRQVLDGLRDPLLHLVRNAVDHGIEPAESRNMVGKPERGTVSIRADLVGPTMRLVVADDGRGIDCHRLAEVLVDKGLLPDLDSVPADENVLLDFLFAEGFTTRSVSTVLSGRGVGLDIVRRRVMQFGGSVRAFSRGPLGGAAFALTVPLSLVSTPLLLVRAGDATCALPVQAVDRAVRVNRRSIDTVNRTPVVTVDSYEPLPLRFLTGFLGLRSATASEFVFALVLSNGGSLLALVVDEVLQEQDAVIRPLPWNLSGLSGVAGAVTLPDGTVAIVPDVAAIFSSKSNAPRRDSARRRCRILVADDSMTTRMLHRNILQEAGYEVVLASDGGAAWRCLQDETVDILVSDVQMPELDGFALTRRIRSDPRLGHLPVVLVTSLTRPDDVQSGLDAGADDYVIKGPLERDALLEAVGKHAG